MSKRSNHGRLLKLTREELKKRDEARDRTERAKKIKRKQKRVPDDGK